tara:strand:+ start:349941 stop:350396 length:456 start_codon:yes stop_codon:yes gene_type:complete
MNDQTQNIHQILAETKVIAVVGMSPKPDRASHYVSAYLQQHGYRVIPVNPVAAGTQILGEHCHATLTLAAAALAEQGLRIDMVDVFRKSDQVLPVAEEAIAIRAKFLWLQIGVINEEAIALARKAGLVAVMDVCPKPEHKKWQTDRAMQSA